ncbi:MAG TPA: hypothetical protein PKL78_12725 [Anaerolineales bacterium]|nr:hypothetical protein [Anaerolineales bacterium]
MADHKTGSHKKKPEVSSDDDVEIGGDVADSVVIHGDGNVIKIIEANDDDSGSSGDDGDNKKKMTNTAIIVALISLLGTIITVVANLYGNRAAPEPTATLAATHAIVFTETHLPTFTPTDTPLPEPTATRVPDTETPIPFTPTPAPVALGEDWKAGCVSRLWVPYPSTVSLSDKGNGCWREPANNFSAENGDLDFLYERSGRGALETSGLFAPLPDSGTLTLTIRLSDLDNVDLWVGVFAEPDVTSKGLLLVIPNGDVKKRTVLQKDPANYETMQGTVALNQGNGFTVSFVFSDLSVRGRVLPNVFTTNQIPISSERKWLFLGYKGLNGSYRIEGTFLNFTLTE